MFDLVTIGDSTFDTFLGIDTNRTQCRVDTKRNELCISYADKICVEHLYQSVGGNAANVAAGAKKLGLHTAIITELGDDTNGLAVIKDLREANVHCGYIQIQKNKETRSSMVLNYGGERTILSYHAKRTYTFRPPPDTSWIYYTSMGQGVESYQKKLITYLKKNPTLKVAANPGSYQIHVGIRSFKQILPHLDILFVNKEELKALANSRSKNIAVHITAMHKAGVKTVVVTDSLKGAYASDAEQVLHIDSYPISATAKTGAGDAFASGFLAYHIQGKDLVSCLLAGTANASGVIEHTGAHKGLLSKKELPKRIKRFRSIQPTVVL